jgi:hypothetical protein
MEKWRSKIKTFVHHTHVLILDERLNAFNTMLFVKKEFKPIASGWLISFKDTQRVSWSGRPLAEQRLYHGKAEPRE